MFRYQSPKTNAWDIESCSKVYWSTRSREEAQRGMRTIVKLPSGVIQQHTGNLKLECVLSLCGICQGKEVTAHLHQHQSTLLLFFQLIDLCNLYLMGFIQPNEITSALTNLVPPTHMWLYNNGSYPVCPCLCWKGMCVNSNSLSFFFVE